MRNRRPVESARSGARNASADELGPISASPSKSGSTSSASIMSAGSTKADWRRPCLARGIVAMPARSPMSCSHGLSSTATSAFAGTPARSSASFTAASLTASLSAPEAMPNNVFAMVSAASARRSRALATTCGAAPPCTRQTFAPLAAYRRHGVPAWVWATQRRGWSSGTPPFCCKYRMVFGATAGGNCSLLHGSGARWVLEVQHGAAPKMMHIALRPSGRDATTTTMADRDQVILAAKDVCARMAQGDTLISASAHEMDAFGFLGSGSWPRSSTNGPHGSRRTRRS